MEQQELGGFKCIATRKSDVCLTGIQPYNQISSKLLAGIPPGG